MKKELILIFILAAGFLFFAPNEQILASNYASSIVAPVGTVDVKIDAKYTRTVFSWELSPNSGLDIYIFSLKEGKMIKFVRNIKGNRYYLRLLPGNYILGSTIVSPKGMRSHSTGSERFVVPDKFSEVQKRKK